MRKINWNKDFQISEEIRIECGWQNTNYGFRHLAVLRVNGLREVETKACYYNRTWESYTYQSVVHKAINKAFTGERAEGLCKAADALGHGATEKAFGGIKAMAAMAGLLGLSPERETSIKKTILSTVPGIDFPEGFDALPEAERKKRLDDALGVL